MTKMPSIFIIERQNKEWGILNMSKKENIKQDRVKEEIEGTSENWENGLLGNDEAFAKVSETVLSNDADDLLALQLISIRLSKSMVNDLKFIAQVNGIKGYQPLIRRVLERFVTAEMNMIAREAVSEANKANDNEDEFDEPLAKLG